MEKITLEKLYSIYLSYPTVCTDTRNIKKDSLFFALKGDNFNGNAFAAQALENGSKYAIVDEEKYCVSEQFLLVDDVLGSLQQLAKYHRQQLKIPFIGITGSNGKTTSKELIHAVLSRKFNTYATFGNLNNHIGVPLTLLSINNTHEMAVIEMGANHMKEIEFLCSLCSPDFGLITNIGKAHLEGFGSAENIVKGKTELYVHIKNKGGLLFVNADDEKLMRLSEDQKRMTYGASGKADFQAKFLGTEPFVTLELLIASKAVKVQTQIIGRYNFDNCVAAACIGNYFGVAVNEIALGLANYVPSNNRSQVMQKGSNTLLMDAYNANPSSMEVAIKNFSALKADRKIAILGDMFELGDESAKEHQQIADLAQADDRIELVLIGPHFLACKVNSKTKQFAQPAQAAEYLKDLRPESSTFLIKGSRGMKLEQLLDSFD